MAPPLQPRSSPVDRASVLPRGSPPLPHLTRWEYNPKNGGGQKCTSTLTALHDENSLDSMTTREVTLSLFCQSVLQQHTMRGAVDGCLVLLLFYLSLHLGRHGMAWGAHSRTSVPLCNIPTTLCASSWEKNSSSGSGAKHTFRPSS